MSKIPKTPFVYCENYDSLGNARSLMKSLIELGFQSRIPEGKNGIKTIQAYLDSAYYFGSTDHSIKG